MTGFTSLLLHLQDPSGDHRPSDREHPLDVPLPLGHQCLSPNPLPAEH